jgi:hypothetical protein
MAGNPHVVSVGIDVAPALRSHGDDAQDIAERITAACQRHDGEAAIPADAAEAIRRVARVLNIAWVEDALERPARIICPRSSHCPITGHCEGVKPSRAREITDVRREIVSHARRTR